MVNVNLAVVSGKRIIQAESLNKDKPVTIKAVRGARYVLAEGEKLVGPENVTVKRVGSNLWLMLEGHEHPQLIIEQYYQHPGDIVALAEDGEWHSYQSANADRGQDPVALQDGELSPILLGSEKAEALTDLSFGSNALGMGLIGLAAIGAATALVFASKSHGGDGKDDKPQETVVSDNKALPLLPINSIHDDFGALQGALKSGDITDDNTPTLSGSGLPPGATVEIHDNGSAIGTAITDEDGNWTYIPEKPLADGSHELVVVVTDPKGNISEPSEPALIVIETSAINGIEALSLEDLLPSDSNPLMWAQVSGYEVANSEVPIQPGADFASHIDDLFNAGHPFN